MKADNKKQMTRNTPGTYLPQILKSGSKAHGVLYIQIHAIISRTLPRDSRPSKGRVIVECLKCLILTQVLILSDVTNSAKNNAYLHA